MSHHERGRCLQCTLNERGRCLQTPSTLRCRDIYICNIYIRRSPTSGMRSEPPWHEAQRQRIVAKPSSWRKWYGPTRWRTAGRRGGARWFLVRFLGRRRRSRLHNKPPNQTNQARHTNRQTNYNTRCTGRAPVHPRVLRGERHAVGDAERRADRARAAVRPERLGQRDALVHRVEVAAVERLDDHLVGEGGGRCVREGTRGARGKRRARGDRHMRPAVCPPPPLPAPAPRAAMTTKRRMWI